ncbi:MAG: NUDIX domain-containing protein [Caldilineaceae bacterium]
MAVGRFMAMIGALVWSPQTEKYLLLKRIAERGGHWECVTGRLEQGECFTDAVHREVKEELGVSVTVDFMIGTAHFYRGASVVENEIVGVHFACVLDDPDVIRLSAEHDDYRWLTATEVDTFLPADRVWLKSLVARTEILRKSLPPALVRYQHIHGFEF